MSTVYHHSDTVRLPWIIHSGELRPGSNRIGDFPNPEFLWATTDARGDRTASAHSGPLYRNGRVLSVRFACDAADFMPWHEAHCGFPQWTPVHVERLEAFAREAGVDPSTWWCRAGPLALDRCRGMATRSYSNPRWIDLPPPEGVSEILDGSDRYLAVFVRDRLFASTRVSGPDGADGYSIGQFAGREAALL